MLTINADGHEVMKHFHKEENEKRSIVVIHNSYFETWLNSNHNDAKELLKLSPVNYLEASPFPKT